MMDLREEANTSSENEDIKYRVVNYLNGIFGSDLKNLNKAKEVLDRLISLHKDLEHQLYSGVDERSDTVFKALKTGENAVERSTEIGYEVQHLTVEVNNFADGKDIFKLLDGLEDDLEKVRYSAKVSAYIKWVTTIQDLSSQIEADLKQDNTDKALLVYAKLAGIAIKVSEFECKNLTIYACKIVVHWHNNLYKWLESDFNSLLKTLQWPFFSHNNHLQAPPPSDLIHKFSNCISRLLCIKVPEKLTEIYTSYSENYGVEAVAEHEELPSFLSNFAVSSFPLQLMLKPFEVRFLYHFSGEKATNSKQNPEWYLTQVLKWVENHLSFITSFVQPILDKSETEAPVNAKYEFMKGLVRLVALKLSSDLPKLQSDEDLFCLTVQETLNFERELRVGLSYSSSLPSVLCVLTQASVFSIWISLERKFSLELMDEFVSDSNAAWSTEEVGGMCSCGQKLVLLLQGITDRYKPLSQPGHRLQFLDLQLELLDDFRVRLLQMTKGELPNLLQSNYIPILNTVHHLVSLISDWGDLPFFIEMQFFKEKFSETENKMRETTFSLNSKMCSRDDFEYDSKKGSSKPSESIFHDILALYSRMEANMLAELNHYALTEVRAQSLSYRKDKWFATPLGSSNQSIEINEISPSFCVFLEVLLKNLLLLRQNLASRLFSIVWKDLASNIDKFIYEEVILENRFSEYGSAQLQYDMTRALLPIFGEYTPKPDSYFPYIKESTILLTLSRPMALLLKDSLRYLNSDQQYLCHGTSASPIKCLQETGIFTLTAQEASVILNIRTNMSIS